MPATVKAKVPAVVIGEPDTEIMPPVNVCATEVTVPEPPDATQDVLVPSVLNTFPVFAVCDGSNAFKAEFAVVCPVPPFAIATVPVTLLAVPVVF